MFDVPFYTPRPEMEGNIEVGDKVEVKAQVPFFTLARGIVISVMPEGVTVDFGEQTCGFDADDLSIVQKAARG